MEHAIRNLQTMLRIVARAGGGALPVVPDGIFGAQTERSLRAFQKAASLPATGQADDATWGALSEAYTRLLPEVSPPEPLEIPLDRPLGTGSRDPLVPLIQVMLLTIRRSFRNLPPVAVTGLYDGPTAEAVRFLQGICGLPAANVFGRRDWRCLAALYRVSLWLPEK